MTISYPSPTPKLAAVPYRERFSPTHWIRNAWKAEAGFRRPGAKDKETGLVPGLATSRITAIAIRAAGPLVLNGSVGARRFDMGTEG
jgi:hypothetical protein